MLKGHFDRCKTLMQKSFFKTKIFIVFLAAVLLSAQASSFTANSSEKSFDFVIASGKGANLSSSNFEAHYSIGDGSIGALNSSGFKAQMGFSRALPYLDGESCNAGIECLVGNCCSGICQSAACASKTTPSSSAAASASTGSVSSAGGGSALLNPSFSLDKSVLKFVLLSGESSGEMLEIENNGDVRLTFNVSVEGIEDLVIINEQSFTLKPNESKMIRLDAFAPENHAPGTYAGRISFDAGFVRKIINVIIDIKQRQALFDIKVVPKKTTISPDENAEADIILYNLGTLKPVDVIVFYSLRDLDGNDLAYGEETVAVREQTLLNRKLRLPENIKPANYLFYSRLSYSNQTAVSSSLLTVIRRESKASEPKATQKSINQIPIYLSFILLAALAIAAGLTAFYLKRNQQITVKVPKERSQETQEKEIQIVLEDENEVGKIIETISFLPKQKPGRTAKRVPEGKDKTRKLLSQIKHWKKQGYDTSLLELEIKALKNTQLTNETQKIKDWKRKGYNTLMLEEELRRFRIEKNRKRFKGLIK